VKKNDMFFAGGTGFFCALNFFICCRFFAQNNKKIRIVGKFTLSRNNASFLCFQVFGTLEKATLPKQPKLKRNKNFDKR
jgi:hypothetical protein